MFYINLLSYFLYNYNKSNPYFKQENYNLYKNKKNIPILFKFRSKFYTSQGLREEN